MSRFGPMRWALLILALTAACGGSGSEQPTDGACAGLRGAECDAALGRAPALGPTPVCEKSIVYFVEGTASAVDITVENASGNTEQASNRSVPLAGSRGDGLRIGTMACGDFVYISAQNQGETGSVTCRIEADNIVIETATSEGSFVIATCSGSVPSD